MYRRRDAACQKHAAYSDYGLVFRFHFLTLFGGTARGRLELYCVKGGRGQGINIVE